jgi:hypothetical protein
MAKINCITIGCPGQVDTTLVCADTTALFGIRANLETQLAELHSNHQDATVMEGHLAFIKKKLDEFEIPDMEDHFKAFKAGFGTLTVPAGGNVRARLTCNGNPQHRNTYDVDCNP